MPVEKRIDPEDGSAYSYDELAAYYKGKYKKAAINTYWETCAPVKKTKGKGKGATAPEPKAKAKVKAKAKAKVKAAPKIDLSVLEKGMKLQAQASDGVYYSAEVVAVSKKNADTPVKVNFVGYTKASDEWVSLTQIRSKVLKEAMDAAKKAAAKPKLTDKELQFNKIANADGFFSALDQSGGSTPKALKIYGVEESEYSGEAEMMDKVHEMRTRMITNPKYNGRRVIGAILFEATMDREISGMPTATFLWKKKRVVPLLKIDKGLADEKDGCQLMKDMPQLDELLDKAVKAGIFGTKERSVIKAANKEGIKKVAEQQFEVGKQICAKGLVPILEPEVDINCPNKAEAEDILLDCLMDGLGKLSPDQKVIFKLTIPTKANLYLPLMSHPNTVRVVALSGGYEREESCKQLSENIGMIASFSRAFAEGLNAKQTDKEFTDIMDLSCKMITNASRAGKKKVQQMAKVSTAPGFLSALDQSGGSTPKALLQYGVEESEYNGEKEMMDKVHEMRSRIITNPKYHGARVLGAILFEATMDRKIEGKPTAKYLWENKKVVPFLKIDKGLADEKDGCQLMKDMPELDKLLDKAVKAGIFGTKERSVIKEPNEEGIKKIAEQQFEIGLKIVAKGLVPILEPEVDIKATNKEKCEELLLKYLLEGAAKLKPEQKVMYKLTIPTKTNLYTPLVEHANTVRVVALSGGYVREESCKMLGQNKGMIGSFSRAFAEGMSAKQSDEEFSALMDKSCQMIYEASRS
jgi:fructose-bisphosphate aldolase class I